jgi:hypothetical protein
MSCPTGKKQVRTDAMELGKVLALRAASSMLCPAGKKWMRTGAMELGKVLTLDLDPSPYVARQARGRKSAKELGKVLPRRVASSMLCPANKMRMRTGAVELRKVLTPESCLLHVVPG